MSIRPKHGTSPSRELYNPARDVVHLLPQLLMNLMDEFDASRGDSPYLGGAKVCVPSSDLQALATASGKFLGLAFEGGRTFSQVWDLSGIGLIDPKSRAPFLGWIGVAALKAYHAGVIDAFQPDSVPPTEVARFAEMTCTMRHLSRWRRFWISIQRAFSELFTPSQP